MIIKKPIDEFTPEEKKQINLFYNKYQEELKDKNKIDQFIGNKLDFLSKYIRIKTICIYLFFIFLINLLFAYLSLKFSDNTLWEDFSYLVLIIIIPPFSFFTWLIIFSIKDKLLKNTMEKYNYLKNNYISSYEEMVENKYENYLEKYSKLEQFEKNKKEYINNVIHYLNKISDEDFSALIKRILKTYWHTNIKKLKGNYFELKNNDLKVLVVYKRINRSISTSDVEKLIAKVNNTYNCCYLFYVGKMSHNAHALINNRYKNIIYINNIYGIAELVYKYIGDLEI